MLPRRRPSHWRATPDLRRYPIPDTGHVVNFRITGKRIIVPRRRRARRRSPSGVLRKQLIDDLVPQFCSWLLGHFLESDRHFIEFMRKTELRVVSRASDRARIHALIAEGRAEDRDLLQLLLEANGYRVTAACGGLEALAAAKSEPPDVIVSNVLMPNMDGFALCRAWMQDAALSAVPFVFYSGHVVRPDDAQVAASLGAARYLVKPLQAEVFLRELGSVLQRQKTQAL